MKKRMQRRLYSLTLATVMLFFAFLCRSGEGIMDFFRHIKDIIH